MPTSGQPVSGLGRTVQIDRLAPMAEAPSSSGGHIAHGLPGQRFLSGTARPRASADARQRRASIRREQRVQVDRPRLAGVGVTMLLLVSAGCASPKSGERHTSPPSTVEQLPLPTSTLPLPPPTRPSVAGFTVQSVSFVSAQMGWALGESACSAGRCFALSKTVDGGSTWKSTTPPPFTISPNSFSFTSATVDFATPHDGWAYDTDESQVGGGTDDQLFATHDGGSSWSLIVLESLDAYGMQVMALSATTGHVWAVLASGSRGAFAIVGSPVNHDNWSIEPLTLTLGAGPVPGFQIVLEGETGWIVDTDRGTLAGASLGNGTWTAWTPPCSGPNSHFGNADIAGRSPRILWAECPPSPYADNPSPAVLLYSSDGGASFSTIGGTPPCASHYAVTPGGVLMCFQEQRIVGSFDGGHTWQTVLAFENPSSPVVDAGFDFASPTVGYVLTPAGTLAETVDGGHSWRSVAFEAS